MVCTTMRPAQLYDGELGHCWGAALAFALSAPRLIAGTAGADAAEEFDAALTTSEVMPLSRSNAALALSKTARTSGSKTTSPFATSGSHCLTLLVTNPFSSLLETKTLQ